MNLLWKSLFFTVVLALPPYVHRTAAFGIASWKQTLRVAASDTVEESSFREDAHLTTRVGGPVPMDCLTLRSSGHPTFECVELDC